MEPVQIFALDIFTGVWSQVTHLPCASSRDPLLPSTGYPNFLADGRIVFYSYANPQGLNPGGEFMAFTVRRDGGELRAVPMPVALPAPRVSSVFHISGEGQTLLNLAVGPGMIEVFLLDGRNFLQLTTFHRADTSGQFVTADGRRAFFLGSADPFGRLRRGRRAHLTNPTHNCQLFSIGTLGAGLRQLTGFREGTSSLAGCSYTNLGCGCAIGSVLEDPGTHAVLFNSSCDPFGTNPNGGQLFAMRLDGSRLRQLTDIQGCTGCIPGCMLQPSRAVSVALPGPYTYSAASPSAATE